MATRHTWLVTGELEDGTPINKYATIVGGSTDPEKARDHLLRLHFKKAAWLADPILQGDSVRLTNPIVQRVLATPEGQKIRAAVPRGPEDVEATAPPEEEAVEEPVEEEAPPPRRKRIVPKSRPG